MAGDHYCCPFELFIKRNGTVGFSGKNKPGPAFSCKRMLTVSTLNSSKVITTFKLLPQLKVPWGFGFIMERIISIDLLMYYNENGLNFMLKV